MHIYNHTEETYFSFVFLFRSDTFWNIKSDFTNTSFSFFLLLMLFFLHGEICTLEEYSGSCYLIARIYRMMDL